MHLLRAVVHGRVEPVDDVCEREDLHRLPWLGDRVARCRPFLRPERFHPVHEQPEADQVEGHLLEDLVPSHHPRMLRLRITIRWQ
jgi:hypothetical protein